MLWLETKIPTSKGVLKRLSLSTNYGWMCNLEWQANLQKLRRDLCQLRKNSPLHRVGCLHNVGLMCLTEDLTQINDWDSLAFDRCREHCPRPNGWQLVHVTFIAKSIPSGHLREGKKHSLKTLSDLIRQGAGLGAQAAAKHGYVDVCLSSEMLEICMIFSQFSPARQGTFKANGKILNAPSTWVWG